MIAFDAVSTLMLSVYSCHLTDRSPQMYPTAGLVFSAIIVRIRLFGMSIKPFVGAPMNPTPQVKGRHHFAPAVHQLQPIAVNIRRDEIGTDRDCDNQTTTTFSKADDAKA